MTRSTRSCRPAGDALAASQPRGGCAGRPPATPVGRVRPAAAPAGFRGVHAASSAASPAPSRALPRPARAGLPGGHGARAHRRDRRQRRRRDHDLQRDGRRDGPRAAVALPDHDRHPGHRPGDGGAPRRRHRAGPLGPHPRPLRRALDGLRDARPAGRERGQHGRRVLRRRPPPRDLRHPALPDGADRRRRHLGAGPLRQLPDRRTRLPRRSSSCSSRTSRRRSWPAGLGRGRPGARHARRSTCARPSCC